MSEALFINKPFVSANLTSGTDTLTYTVPSGADGIYTVHADVYNPPATGMSVVVKQGVTTVYTAPTEGQTETLQKFRYSQLYSAADVISVVLTSATATDKALNAVKAIVAVRQGL